MILGLDISTSITGFTVIDFNGNVKECSYIDLRKRTGLFSKAMGVETELKKVFEKYPIEKVWIEASLMMFTPGKSSATTIDALAKFNGIVSWIVYQLCGDVNFIPAVSARKNCGIRMQKGRKGKDLVMEYMLNNETWFKVERTKNDKIQPYCFDQADSFIIAKAGYLQWTAASIKLQTL